MDIFGDRTTKLGWFFLGFAVIGLVSPIWFGG